MERTTNENLPVKTFHADVTCLLDLPDEILLMLCRYLSTYDVFNCFYTSEQSDSYLHRLIQKYYTKICLDVMQYNKCEHLLILMIHPKSPLRPKSLILNNQYGFIMRKHTFFYMSTHNIRSILNNLTHLTLINCSSSEICTINNDFADSMKLEYIHITMYKDKNAKTRDPIEYCDTVLSYILFIHPMSSLHTVIVEPFDGLPLYKSMAPNENLRHINITLLRIDDLYILLNGFVPNIEILSVRLCQSRLSKFQWSDEVICHRLIDFTLFDSCTAINVDDIESLFICMPNLRKLTLSVRDTPDRRFSHGLTIESMLNKHVPHLCQFDYTMTHRIDHREKIEDFRQWPMRSVYYEHENIKWIHMFSVPWPSNQQDKREVPIINGDYHLSVTSDVKYAHYLNHVNITTEDEMLEINKKFSRARQLTTCLSINIKLPRQISKLILSAETPIGSMNFIPQENIYCLLVERRLIDENEIKILANQFPRVRYLELLFPLEPSSCIRCFQTLFSLTAKTKKRCFWSELIEFRTKIAYGQTSSIWCQHQLRYWLISNTDLKHWPNQFFTSYSDSMWSVWL
ncbi:unnamed protein product [Rotaria magnacalcarata]|uniref:F-box domain-containing protein n=1 Tax=Rotaria magnacalcarata TaxID=392030 RepID=A0A820D3K4_9BILA|nr:unnamed protein product [Rotaria magnacalcarata]CAF4225897.1 unnamed protein product [Rotaria magnacalcarata]